MSTGLTVPVTTLALRFRSAKADADSYRRIAAAMARPPSAIVFISDTTRELDAARAEGAHRGLDPLLPMATVASL